jgi:hypothetical protein
MRAHRALVLAAAFGLAAGTPAAAQPRRAAAGATAAPEVFGGYSFTQAGEANLHGVGFSGSYPLSPAFRLVLDLSGHAGSYAGADLGQFGFMAGARWTPASGRLRPFAESVLGGVRTSVSVDAGGTSVSEAETDWGLAIGGGADYSLSGAWSLRALVHLRMLNGESGWDTDPRFAVGVSYRLGQ